MSEIFSSIFGTHGLILGTIIPFLFVLLVVVFVHEMGHYLVGRLCGIGVKAFSLGFGPELFGFNDAHGTRWKLSAIPLGGYVKFVGDMTVTGEPAHDEELSPEERRVAFHTQAVWKRALTVFAGPFFNFLLTVVVFAVMFAAFGRYVYEPTVAEVRAGSPAAVAGFQPGDKFLSVDGTKVETFGDVQRLVSGRAGDKLTFGVERGGRRISLFATPKAMEEKDALGNTVRIGVIGVVNDEASGKPRHIAYSPVAAVGQAIDETGSVIGRTWQFMKRFAAGREDRCQLGGPVKIADMAGKAASLGFEWLIQLVALLSVGIGVLNLLPIPPLDGGHLLFYACEAILRRPLPERVMEMFYRVGLFAVLAFMVFVFWNDIFGC